MSAAAAAAMALHTPKPSRYDQQPHHAIVRNRLVRHCCATLPLGCALQVNDTSEATLHAYVREMMEIGWGGGGLSMADMIDSALKGRYVTSDTRSDGTGRGLFLNPSKHQRQPAPKTLANDYE